MKVIVVIGLCLQLVNSFDIKSVQEQKCLETSPTPAAVDLDWANKVGNWYISSGSQLHAYRTAAEILTVNETEILPHDLYYRSCMKFAWGEKTILTGFGDKSSNVDLKLESDGSFIFHFPNHGLDAKTIIVLTDNESYVLFYTCWSNENHDATWAVLSTGPTLPIKIKQEIKKQIKTLGFSEKQFTVLRFDSCDASDAE